MEEAIAAGKATAVINSGFMPNPVQVSSLLMYLNGMTPKTLLLRSLSRVSISVEVKPTT